MPGTPGPDIRDAREGRGIAAPPPRPYGRILIFTLLDDRTADFDRLAEQTAEEVRTGEPDTLVYVIHLVPNAPLQRIFYEIYRDRAAFDSHESQPYIKRFVADRRSFVLATNVIELTLKYAKVAPLPNPQPAYGGACRPGRRPCRPGRYGSAAGAAAGSADAVAAGAAPERAGDPEARACAHRAAAGSPALGTSATSALAAQDAAAVSAGSAASGPT